MIKEKKVVSWKKSENTNRLRPGFNSNHTKIHSVKSSPSKVVVKAEFLVFSFVSTTTKSIAKKPTPNAKKKSQK